MGECRGGKSLPSDWANPDENRRISDNGRYQKLTYKREFTRDGKVRGQVLRRTLGRARREGRPRDNAHPSLRYNELRYWPARVPAPQRTQRLTKSSVPSDAGRVARTRFSA